MRVLIFKDSKKQADWWRALRAGYRFRTAGPSGFLPVVQIGGDPDRIAAAIEIKAVFDQTSDEHTSEGKEPEEMPFEIVLEDSPFNLLKEYWEQYKQRMVTPDTAEDCQNIDAFLKEAPKYTPEEWKARTQPETG